MISSGDTGQALVVTFPSTHQALKFDRKFKSRGPAFQLMPVPRQISSSCGLAAKVTDLDWEQLLLQLTAADIEYDAVYLLGPQGKPQRLTDNEEQDQD